MFSVASSAVYAVSELCGSGESGQSHWAQTLQVHSMEISLQLGNKVTRFGTWKPGCDKQDMVCADWACLGYDR